MISLHLFFASLLLSSIASTSQTVTQEVNLSSGRIRGRQVHSYGNHSGFAFLGIPLAQPPIGNLRFKKPVLPSNWPGVLETLQYRSACIANPKFTYKTDAGGPISEDCLYVNVIASAKCIEKGGCAVMAVVHGGLMNFESPVSFKPDVIVNNFANEERNIVVVTLPYRLGTLGWFNIAPYLNTSVDSNQGLRDVIFGLEWIQREISSFGGDVTRVTLMGHSAGAMLIQQAAVSPSARGLMQQVVSMNGPGSGGDINPITNSRDSERVAKLLGCAKDTEKFEKTERVEEIISCIRSKSSGEILAVQNSLIDYAEDTYGPWLDNEILPDFLSSLESGRPSLNMMIGTVTGEMRDARFCSDDKGVVIEDRLRALCSQLGYEMHYSNPEAFEEACCAFYSPDNKAQMLDDDRSYYHHSAQLADSYSKNGKAFVYSYSYTGAGFAYDHYNPNRNHGPIHSEDYIYILGLHRVNSSFTPKDYQIERIYSGMLASFVNNGDPTYENHGKWEPWSPKRRNYFHVDFDDELRMPGNTDGYHSEASVFWTDIVNKVAGTSKPSLDLPPLIDYFQVCSVVQALNSHYLNESNGHDKTMKGENILYEQWTTHLQHLKKKRMQEKKGTLLVRAIDLQASVDQLAQGEELEENSQSGISLSGVLMLLAVVSIVLLVAYIATIKFCAYRKRRQYVDM